VFARQQYVRAPPEARLDPNPLAYLTAQGVYRCYAGPREQSNGRIESPMTADSLKARSNTSDVDQECEHSRVDTKAFHFERVAVKGSPVILLHGYAQNSHMWRPLMKELAKTHLVVAPDLRGFGDSAKAESGYDKKTMAQDVHALAQSLGIQKTAVAGHDIGLM